MQKKSSHSNCLGCRTFFQENQVLSLETMTVEYKNFPLPIVQHKHRWNLLKTIVSFLNTKGGTIYIGVDDNECKVVGKQLTSKMRDQFKLYLLTLIERIVPQVDLNVKEEVCVQYIPVVKNKTFTGKYLVKIIIQQGDPSQTYCFSQKIQWALEGKKDIENQCENAEIVYAFVRHNLGGARQIKGMKLIEQAIKKAQNPSPKFTTFHVQCNPEPQEHEIQTKKIGFRNLGNRQARRKFERIFKANLQKLTTQFEVVYDTQLKAVVIQLPTVQEFKKVNNFIRTNLSFLNESQNEVRFVEVGEFMSVHFYQNTLNKNGVQQEQNKSPSKQKTSQKSKASQKVQQKVQQKIEQKIEQKSQQKTEQKKKPSESKQSKSQAQTQDQNFSLTFTHINPYIKDKLINYLEVSISKKIPVQTEVFQNTIEVSFESLDDLQKYSKICMQNSHLRALQGFGFNRQIRIGPNTSHLHVLNYDKSKQQKLINFLKSTMGKDLKQTQILKRGNRYVIDCKMARKNLACEWLDRLLVSRPLKDFRIPGAQNGSAPKMKVFIHCQEIKP